MKTFLTASALALACAMPAFAADPSLTEAGDAVTLKTVTQTLPTLTQYTKVEQPNYAQVPAWSNDRVKIEASTWAEYGVQAADILNLVRQGQIDVGAAPLAQVSGQVPFLEIADLAGLSPDVKTAKAVTDAVIDSSNEALSKYGIRIIGTYPFPANVMFCKGDIKGLADLKDRKVRTFGPSQNDLVQSFGAQTVSIGFPEVYGALETGVADCAVTAALSGNAAKWYEVTESMLNIPVSWGTGGYYVSQAWWDSLDPAVQNFVGDLYAKISDEEWALAAAGTQDGVACNTGDAANCKIGQVVTGDQAMSVTNASDADTAALKEKLSSVVIPAWVGRCGADCAEKFDAIVGPITGLKATN
ncbi:TRAP transporter substrate-binding protein [Frigidibacter sp. MR17.24]|uniref:TRAP transporter substrate-binding protein n=1 Tax=Frigidibacter sp. MR17.24 TaxID=3127345 RepID=UPI003012CF25